MKEESSIYVTAEQWQRLTHAVREDSGVTHDGAEAQVVRVPNTSGWAITFYAAKQNAPEGWPYAFLEPDHHGHERTYIGDAQRDDDGRLTLQVYLKEAVEQLLADYEGGVTDLSEGELEDRAAEVASGRDADRKWLRKELLALLATCEISPSPSPQG